MLNKDFITNIVVILVLVFLQVFVFNHILFLGKYNPLVFLMYILFAPASTNFNRVLLSSFVMGLMIDLFFQTVGINALCCIFAVLIRQLFLGHIFSKGDASYLQFSDLNALQILSYVFSISMFYNLLLYTIESFNFSNFVYALQEGSMNGLVTFVFIYIFYLLFKNTITS